MEIQRSTVEKLKITDVKNLDHVSVFLEDLEPGKGKITIECYGKSWSNYWGGMGDRTISKFFCSANNDYIAGKMDGSLRHNAVDEDSIPEHAKNHVKQLLSDFDIDDLEANELLSELNGWSGEDLLQNREILSKIYGPDYWYSLPEIPNHEYEYLCRILNAVKAALKQIEVENR